MVTVRVTETYDLKTTKNKLGIIGIHTPSGGLVRRLYPGLVKSYRYIRMKKCDVVGACASVLPADPLQVGVTSGDIAPEDMFNPILYTAVSNSSFDTLVSRINNANTDISALNSVSKEDLNWANSDAQFQLYYSLLSENGKWKKAMPQSGFAIKNLVPLAHTLLSTFGNEVVPSNIVLMDEDADSHNLPDNLADTPMWNSGSGVVTNPTVSAYTFRGKTVKMPRVPIHYGVEGLTDIPTVDYPKTMVACILTPPARLHEFYYRMRVTWTISFEELITANEVANSTVFTDIGSTAYAKSYTFSLSKNELENGTDSVDTNDVEINKIMES